MQRGENHHNYKGGRRRIYSGYILIHNPTHPFCDKNGYVKNSRLVGEKILGRYLTRKEVVHHINSIKDDDRPGNLMGFVSNGYHRAFHRWGYYNSKYIIFDGRKIIY